MPSTLATRASRGASAPDSAPAVRTSVPFRRGKAWATLGLFLLVLIAAMGLFRSAQIPARGEAIPASAESARVAAELATRPGSDIAPMLLVATRRDGAALTAADTQALAGITGRVTPSDLPPVGPPQPSVAGDGVAAYTLVPVRSAAQNSDNIDTITNLREAVGKATPADLQILVTGGPAFGADIANAFSGADFRLLMVTVAIVGVLLLLTYRSPILWLIPLSVVALADQLAAVVTKALGAASGLTFDAGIVSVLVFGAGTNYALLLISRYREELRREADHRVALQTARRTVLPAILASNATVVLALLTLLLAVVPGTRGLGLAGAAGLVIAALAALLPLPAVLSLVGRRVFWPVIPRAGMPQTQQGGWSRLGHAVVRRPALVVAAGVLVLGGLATGLVGTHLGLTQAQQFRVASDSQRGLEVVADHFPAGIAAPLTVITDAPAADAVAAAVRAVDGVATVSPLGRAEAGQAEAGRAVLTVIGDAAPGSTASTDLVREVRAAAHGIPGAQAIVGGSPAVAVDAHTAADRDLRRVVPLVLGVTVLVLMVLLRAVLAPLVLLAINVLSALATIGAGAWVGRTLFDFPALDVQVPLIAFLFLVALGVDYTIFLVHRADAEAARHGIREGMARAVGHTGAVITSAGIVLAGVFAALGVLPLVVLGQLGLIVGLGVVVDTFVVRTLLVPGAIALLGDRAMWPRRVQSAR